ncbi:hypothetical protein ASPFODRAFT_453562 [Aspergillus luchuensis CBS 106.47]|uniref:Uncharacterized protein n=1 Tax=Aspergillus luchuensis (strain CBS 106.47) TaxID=1137211 RepID=A0A1M3TXG8_ASPLC|nr:hypothetical protein ASPFODRAFT_453562 [Aspergillus luchuensis CBS 106.47]
MLELDSLTHSLPWSQTSLVSSPAAPDVTPAAGTSPTNQHQARGSTPGSLNGRVPNAASHYTPLTPTWNECTPYLHSRSIWTLEE